MDERETEGAADNATAAYNTTLMEVARDAYTALEKLQGAAAAAAVPNNTVTQITQDALLKCLKECEEQSHEVNHWIDYVKFNISRSLPLLKRKAQAAAIAFTTLEHLMFKVENLHDKWEEVNTVPDNKLIKLITH